MRKKLSKTKWFKVVSARAKAIAKRTGRQYPSYSIEEHRALHMEAEKELGSQLDKLVKDEFR